MDIDCLQDMVPHRFLPATSESPSDIWEFKSKTGSVFCKVFSDSDQLHYESTVYEYLDEEAERLGKQSAFFVRLGCIRRNVSFADLEKIVCSGENMLSFGRNMIIMRASLLRNMAIIQCGNPSVRPALTDTSSELSADMIPSCDIGQIDKFRHVRYTILVTHRPEGHVRDMHDFVKDATVSDHAKVHVLVQLVDAINIMHTLGISHNDQHWGNILVTENDAGGYRPILFDWDRAQMTHGPPNRYIRNFSTLYKPSSSFARDWLTLYCEITTHSRYLSVDHTALYTAFFSTFSVFDIWINAVLSGSWWTFATEQVFRQLSPHVNVQTKLLQTLLTSVIPDDLVFSPALVDHVDADDVRNLNIVTRVVDSWSDVVQLSENDVRRILQSSGSWCTSCMSDKPRVLRLVSLIDHIDDKSNYYFEYVEQFQRVWSV